jgi:hypothetical protein
MKKVSELISWLNSANHVKCTLVDITEVSDTLGNQYSFKFSSAAYNGVDNYLPIIDGGLTFSESLSVEGSISSSFGSLQLSNIGGEYDSYLQYVWKRRPIKIYLGDPSWPKVDFVLIFDGLIDDLISSDENSLTISIFDKLQKLNDNITEETLLNTNYSQKTENTVLPVLLGECFNIQPLLVDNGISFNSGEVYMYHNGAANGVIEVRDNGVPIAVTENNVQGTFSLLTAPRGTITCSAQGRTPYTNTVPGLITALVKNYGAPHNRFTDSEIAFESFTNNSKVGIYCKDRQNILEACSQLAKSVNSGLICPSITVADDAVSASKLKLVELKVPTGTPVYRLNDASMVEGSLSISQTFPVKPLVKLSYCKNYTVQSSVASGLNPAINFAFEYSYANASDSIQQTLYKDSGTVSEEPTLLLVESEAEAEANKRLELWSTQRFLITAQYLPEYIFVQLGDIVSIQSNRFNLSQEKLGIVFSIERDWVTGMTQIGVLI